MHQLCFTVHFFEERFLINSFSPYRTPNFLALLLTGLVLPEVTVDAADDGNPREGPLRKRSSIFLTLKGSQTPVCNDDAFYAVLRCATLILVSVLICFN